MSNYHVLICRYPIDGVLLALELASSSSPLIVAPSADLATAIYFNISERVKLGDALQPDAVMSKLSLTENNEAELALGYEQPAAGLLTRLRESFSKRDQVFIPLTYERVEGDLPLLRSNDQVSLFWNSDELLSDRYLKRLRYLEERLESEKPKFSGIHFYHSQDEAPTDRLQAVNKASSLDTTESIRIEGGDRWSKACL